MSKEDIITLKGIATELGADFAEIIEVKDIVWDLRARFKCLSCRRYGKKATCPPNIESPEFFEKLYKKYESGILIGKKWDLSKETMEKVREVSGKSIHKILLNLAS